MTSFRFAAVADTVSAQEVTKMFARRRFRVVFARDDNDHWFVDAIDVPGAHSHGQTLDAARRNIWEAIALVLEIDDEGFDLDEQVRFPDEHVQMETSG